MKIPNDLIKATNLEKQKHRMPKEFEYVNGKFIQHYVLGGEAELTPEQIVDCLNALAMIDGDLQMAYAVLQDKSHENKVLKKVIDKIKKFSKDLYFYNKDVDETIKKECDVYNYCLKNLQEVIEQAEKEVTENES